MKSKPVRKTFVTTCNFSSSSVCEAATGTQRKTEFRSTDGFQLRARCEKISQTTFACVAATQLQLQLHGSGAFAAALITILIYLLLDNASERCGDPDRLRNTVYLPCTVWARLNRMRKNQHQYSCRVNYHSFAQCECGSEDTDRPCACVMLTCCCYCFFSFRRMPTNVRSFRVLSINWPTTMAEWYKTPNRSQWTSPEMPLTLRRLLKARRRKRRRRVLRRRY